jgi:hypothetical protein
MPPPPASEEAIVLLPLVEGLRNENVLSPDSQTLSVLDALEHLLSDTGHNNGIPETLIGSLLDELIATLDEEEQSELDTAIQNLNEDDVQQLMEATGTATPITRPTTRLQSRIGSILGEELDFGGD